MTRSMTDEQFAPLIEANKEAGRRIERLELILRTMRYRAALEKIVAADYRGNEPEWYRIAKEALRD